MIPPGPLTGTDPWSRWLERLRKFVISLVFRDGAGYRVVRTTAGTMLEFDEDVLGSGAGVIALSVFEVTELSLKCYALNSNGDPVTDGAVYWVGKPYHLGEGRLVSDGTNNLDRLEDVPGDFERNKRLAIYDFDGTELESEEVVIPAYRNGSVILATRAPTGLSHKTDSSTNPGTLIEWVDLNRDARYWTMKHVHAGVCVDEVTKSQVIQGGTISD